AGQLVWHGCAVCLVVRRELITESAPGQVEGGRDVFRVVFLQQLAQHRDEDVDGIGRLALRVPQERALGCPDRGVVRAIHLRAAVDQIQDAAGGDGGESFVYNIGWWGGSAPPPAQHARGAGGAAPPPPAPARPLPPRC